MRRELERSRRLDELTASALVLARVTPEAPPEPDEALLEGLHELERGLRVLVDDTQGAAPFVALRLVARDLVAVIGARAPEPAAEESAAVPVPVLPAGAIREAS
jgi:hypothetical protein